MEPTLSHHRQNVNQIWNLACPNDIEVSDCCGGMVVTWNDQEVCVRCNQPCCPEQ